MTVQTDSYAVGSSGTASQKFTVTAPNDGTLKIGRGVLGAESSFPMVINADDSVSGVFSGLGVGQTPQSVVRALGTTYTNSTGKPIHMCVQVTSGAGTSAVQVTIAGVVHGAMYAIAGSWVQTCSFIIPNGATYVINNLLASPTISVVELR